VTKGTGYVPQASHCLSWGISPRHQVEGWHSACSTGTLAPGRAGVVRRSLWGLGAPKPLPAETDCWSMGLLLPGCVPREPRERARAPSPERPPWRRGKRSCGRPLAAL